MTTSNYQHVLGYDMEEQSRELAEMSSKLSDIAERRGAAEPEKADLQASTMRLERGLKTLYGCGIPKSEDTAEQQEWKARYIARCASNMYCVQSELVTWAELARHHTDHSRVLDWVESETAAQEVSAKIQELQLRLQKDIDMTPTAKTYTLENMRYNEEHQDALDIAMDDLQALSQIIQSTVQVTFDGHFVYGPDGLPLKHTDNLISETCTHSPQIVLQHAQALLEATGLQDSKRSLGSIASLTQRLNGGQEDLANTSNLSLDDTLYHIHSLLSEPIAVHKIRLSNFYRDSMACPDMETVYTQTKELIGKLLKVDTDFGAKDTKKTQSEFDAALKMLAESLEALEEHQVQYRKARDTVLTGPVDEYHLPLIRQSNSNGPSSMERLTEQFSKLRRYLPS